MAAIFGPRTKYGCQIWSLGQFLGRTIFAMTGQVQGRHLHPRGETVRHGAVPDLALMDAAGTSQPHVCI